MSAKMIQLIRNVEHLLNLNGIYRKEPILATVCIHNSETVKKTDMKCINNTV